MRRNFLFLLFCLVTLVACSTNSENMDEESLQEQPNEVVENPEDDQEEQPTGDCIQGDVLISTLEDLSQFKATYADCNIIEGDLHFQLEEVGGSDELASIETVTGDVIISGLSEGVDINGLFNIKIIGGNLTITGNSVNFGSIFPNLEEIGGELIIRENFTLEVVDGFDSLQSVGFIRILENPDLLLIEGFTSLVSDGGMMLRENPELLTISGFSGLENSENWILIFKNNKLERVTGFENLTVATDLEIVDCPVLNDLSGYSKLEVVTERLTLHRLFNLQTVNNFSNLNTTGELFISTNTQLQNLDGFSNITSPVQHVTIWYNDILASIEGLSDISSIENELDITNNPSLANCSLEAICSLLSADGLATIENNMTGCNDKTQILDSCN